MDGSILIAVLIAGMAVLIFVPLSIVSRKERRKKQIRNKTIADEVCQLHNLTLSKTDIVNDQLLGLDQAKKILVYSDLEAYPDGVTIVHLSEIEMGALVKNIKRVEENGRNRLSPEIHISDIGIALYAHSKKLLVECIFYDDIKNNLAQMSDLTQNAKNWLKELGKITPLKITERTI